MTRGREPRGMSGLKAGSGAGAAGLDLARALRGVNVNSTATLSTASLAGV